MKAKYKRLTGAGICITWGMLCAILMLSGCCELINDDGYYTLVGLPVMISSIVAWAITIGIEQDCFRYEFLAYGHTPKIFTVIVLLSVQFILYASIGLLVPWNKFKLKKNSPVPPAPESPQD